MRTWHTILTGWHTSSYSHFEENACVDVGTGDGLVGVRDSKQAALPGHVRPVLVFGAPSFGAFLAHLKARRP
ncbi:DUF397 domain-containing protein [Amycolatopsis sp. NPDC059021]|uniref:DUF397 domain-containing protein n=1 Tax=Amycolatopsis sp. NPDC059021 TaxID=3346704 RepID=UPI00366DD683